MKEQPQPLDGLNVRDGWDRREMRGRVYFVRTEDDPATDIHTEWYKPVGEGGLFKRVDTVLAPPNIQRVLSGDNWFLGRKFHEVSRPQGQVIEKIDITTYTNGHEAVNVDFSYEGDSVRVSHLGFVYNDHNLDHVNIIVRGKWMSVPDIMADAEARPFDENLALLRDTLVVNAARYPADVAAVATIYPDYDYDELMKDTEFDVKSHLNQIIELDDSEASESRDDWADKALDKVFDEVKDHAALIVDTISTSIEASKKQKDLMKDGMHAIIMKKVPSNFDMVNNPDERERILQKARAAAVAEIAGSIRFATARASDVVLTFQLDPNDTKVQLTSTGEPREVFNEETYVLGQLYNFEGVTYVAEETDGIVRVSVASQNGDTLQVQAPRHVDTKKVKAQILSSDKWVNTLDDLSIKS